MRSWRASVAQAGGGLIDGQLTLERENEQQVKTREPRRLISGRLPNEDDEGSVVKVRTGEMHQFSADDAAEDKFTVSDVPSIDYATKALIDAQDRYYKQWPEARKYARAHLWDIRPNQ